MSLNKKILALAIAGMYSGASFATLDLQTDVTTPIFAEEIALPLPSGESLENNGDILTVQTLLGFSIVGSSKYVRFDYPGSKPEQNLTLADFSLTGGTGTISISAGGTTNDNFVIIEIANGDLDNTDTLVFKLPAGPAQGIIPDSKNDHFIFYRLYSQPAEAVNAPALGAPDPFKLASASGTWYKFGKALDLSCDAVSTTKKIDPNNAEEFTDGSTDTDLFSVTAKTNANVYRRDGALVSIFDYLAAGTTFKVLGQFGFVTDLVLAGQSIDLVNQLWTAPPLTLPLDESVAHLFVDGTTPMQAGPYSLLVTPAAGSLNTAPITDDCSSLEFAGSSDRVDFVVTPGNPNNKQWFRITNPSETSGAVTVQVWNDAGQTATFPLRAVNAAFGTKAPLLAVDNVLGKQSSTALAEVADFLAAAQGPLSSNPAFAIGTNVDGQAGKVRIEVRGAFGDNHVDGVRQFNPIGVLGKSSTVRLKDGIYIESILQGAAGVITQSH